MKKTLFLLSLGLLVGGQAVWGMDQEKEKKCEEGIVGKKRKRYSTKKDQEELGWLQSHKKKRKTTEMEYSQVANSPKERRNKKQKNIDWAKRADKGLPKLFSCSRENGFLHAFENFKYSVKKDKLLAKRLIYLSKMRVDLSKCCSNGFTPLMMVVIVCAPYCVEALIRDCGVDANVECKHCCFKSFHAHHFAQEGVAPDFSIKGKDGEIFLNPRLIPIDFLETKELANFWVDLMSNNWRVYRFNKLFRYKRFGWIYKNTCDVYKNIADIIEYWAKRYGKTKFGSSESYTMNVQKNDGRYEDGGYIPRDSKRSLPCVKCVGLTSGCNGKICKKNFLPEPYEPKAADLERRNERKPTRAELIELMVECCHCDKQIEIDESGNIGFFIIPLKLKLNNPGGIAAIFE